jgi:protein-disulfide isomerase
MRTIFTLALLMALSSACDKAAEGREPTAAPAASEAAAPAAAPAEAEGTAQADAPSSERYPLLNFELLDPAERTRYVGLAEGEICPCGALESLDACLQREDVCSLGAQAGALMMQLVKQGAQDLAITDQVQQFIDNARRVWTFDLDDAPWAGAEEPEVVLVNFSDFECPHCREFAAVLDEAVERYGDSVRVYYKQFPLGGRRNSSAAAVAALAAHRQGQFVAFHDAVFERQTALSTAPDPTAFLLNIANELGLNMDRFTADANDPALRAQVDADRLEGMNAGVMSTPTCYVDGVRMMDGYSLDALTQRIDAALAE